MTIARHCLTVMLLFFAAAVNAAQTMDMSEVIALLQQQQKDLAEQRKLLEAQAQQINGLQQELDVLRTPAPETSVPTIATLDVPAQTGPPQPVEQGPPAPLTKQEQKTAAGESVAKAQTDDPTRDLLADFTGAWRLPGTNAALAIGGYVKATIVNNFDALDIKDRFIVGAIPVDDTDTENNKAQSSITASQSRLNFDLREPTDVGMLRAFIEGDFAGDGETFRMRHAFGQWNRILAGKTWSAFVDTEASPEEVDFEGLNGRISVRQSQVRIIPSLGESYELLVSLEDPNPQVQNGQGITRTPDIIASARFHPHERLHMKLALIARQIRGQLERGSAEQELGGGATVSGRITTPLLDERDSVLFQLNAGNGIGRYVNDLASVGSFDGIFNLETGELELFEIVAGYVSYQHWWGRNNMRSNFTFGVVEVDNPDFVSGDAYKRTLRFSSNLMWSPTPRIDLGTEYLWGNRKNENGDNNDATQIQVMARYRF